MISTADSFRGQVRAVKLLGDYVARGRLAGTILILGQRGLGKTTLATIIARSLTCKEKPAAGGLAFCGACYACRSIQEGQQPEYVHILPRGKEISVKQVEEDIDGFRAALMHPTMLSHRVFVIDDAHYLNTETGNQLLKVFEEAPECTVFLLITDKPGLLLPTIHSRGQKITLLPMPQEELTPVVAADAGVGAEVAGEAALMAAGRYVDAMFLAASGEWRDAVRNLARSIFRGGDDRAVENLAAFEYEMLWGKELRDRNLGADQAEKLMGDSKSEVGKGLKTRRNELHRQALIGAYDRSSWWALSQGTPPAGYLDVLSRFKSRVNQNVDPALSQAAFEAELM